MKKISLKTLNLNETEALSREQLKNVLGGQTSETEVCPSDSCGGINGACPNNRPCNTYACPGNPLLTYKDCGPAGT